MAQFEAIYWLPAIPILVRILIITVFFSKMRDILPESQNDRANHRSVFIPLATLSFTGLLALAVLDQETQSSYSAAIYFLLVGFLAYLIATNLQGYKNRRWHDQIGDALAETGSLCLLASVSSIVWASGLGTFRVVIVSIASIAWLLDFAVRTALDIRYLYLLTGEA